MDLLDERLPALRSVDFLRPGKVYQPDPPHAQSLFLFPIVFVINSSLNLPIVWVRDGAKIWLLRVVMGLGV